MDFDPVNLGRLAEIKIRKNADARQAAMESICQLPDRRWSARLGGRIKGQTVYFIARGMAVTAVDAYYNEELAHWLRSAPSQRSKPGRVLPFS